MIYSALFLIIFGCVPHILSLRLCEWFSIAIHTHIVSVDIRMKCGNWPARGRFLILQRSILCDVRMLDGQFGDFSNPRGTFIQSSVQCQVLVVKSQCNIFPDETEGCCEHWFHLTDSHSEPNKHRFFNASYIDEGGYSNKYLNFTTVNPLAPSNASIEEIKTIELMDFFRKQDELRRLGLTVTVEKHCRKIVKKVCTPKQCDIGDNCYGQNCLFRYEDYNSEVCSAPDLCLTTFPIRQLCDWKNCAPKAFLKERKRRGQPPSCL